MEISIWFCPWANSSSPEYQVDTEGFDIVAYLFSFLSASVHIFPSYIPANGQIHHQTWEETLLAVQLREVFVFTHKKECDSTL